MPSLLCLTLACSLASPPIVERLSEAIEIDELRDHVTTLASPDYLGRRGPGAARAARYIAERFQALKLAPAFNGSYDQPIPWLIEKEGRDSFAGRNIGAMLPGSDPALADEWIVINAHYDHLGQKGDTYWPGADDNASGVAALIEIAERFALAERKPKRTILFVAFDLEEQGLLGSAHFATHPPLPFRKLRASLTADMIGRSMANVMDEYVFVLGAESSPGWKAILRATPPPKGLTMGRLGADIIGTRSDYGPFRDRKVPFLFFSTGQHPDYHRPTDTADKIQYDKLQRIADWMHNLTASLADSPKPPAWSDDAPAELAEAETMLNVVSRVLDNPMRYPLSVAQKQMAQNAQVRLAGMVERGMISESERSWLVWTARLLLATVF
jgi:hypothetical protein